MTLEAEITVMQLQTRECWQPPETRKGPGGLLPENLQRRHGPAYTLLQDSRTVRKLISV